MRPPINTVTFFEKCAQASWFCPTAISTMASGLRLRNTLLPTIVCKPARELSQGKFGSTSPQLRDDILDFYSDLSLPIETKKDASRWQGVLSDLNQLKSAPAAPAAAEPAH